MKCANCGKDGVKMYARLNLVTGESSKNYCKKCYDARYKPKGLPAVGLDKYLKPRI